MLDLTPGERRGALILLLVFTLGTAWDLWRREPVPAPPVPEAPVPAAPLAGPAVAVPSGSAAAIVDLNTAGPSELDALPGIGPVLAARIVAHRNEHGPFRSADELLGVRGIGPRLFEKLQPRVVAGRARRTAAGPPVQIARPVRH